MEPVLLIIGMSILGITSAAVGASKQVAENVPHRPGRGGGRFDAPSRLIRNKRTAPTLPCLEERAVIRRIVTKVPNAGIMAVALVSALLATCADLCSGAETTAVNTKLRENLEAGKKQTVVVYGTSLTSHGEWVKQVKAVLEKNYPDQVTLHNCGGSGKNSEWGLGNLDAVLKLAPDVVLIEFSVNDAVKRFNISVETTRKNLETMIARIKGTYPSCEIIIQVMNPAIAERLAGRPNYSAYQQMYRDFAKEHHFILIDHMPAWETLLKKGETEFRKLVPDGLHPTPDGCREYVTPTILTTLGFKAEATVVNGPGKIPICMIIDDGAPFSKVFLARSGQNIEVPTSFYREFGDWAKVNGIKGKLSVIPCYRPATACIDGCIGEYPGHSKEERLEWIMVITTVYMPCWTITPEIITHSSPWDIKRRKMLSELPRENVWLPAQSLEAQTEYIAEAMRMLKNAGIESGGLTMCFSYPAQKNHILGEVTLRAAETVLGLNFVMIFNDPGRKPGIIYRRDDGAMAVSIRPNIDDQLVDHGSGSMTEADIERDADKYIGADGKTGLFVTRIAEGGGDCCLIFNTHIWGLWGNGTKSGFKSLKIAIERLNRYFGDRLEWMTGLEICKHYCSKNEK